MNQITVRKYRRTMRLKVQKIISTTFGKKYVALQFLSVPQGPGSVQYSKAHSLILPLHLKSLYLNQPNLNLVVNSE